MGLPDIETIPETGAVFTIGRSRFADNVASHFFIRKDPVVGITCGDEHSAVVCQTGRLFVFGSNDWGQLGLGHKNHISKPSCVKILKPEKVTHVACGRAHTLICIGGQKIFACGSNQEGQLGRESSAIGDSSSSPILIYDCGLAGPRILQLAAGSHHSMALTSDGGVVAWGSNLEGQLGLPGISGLVNKPTKVPIPEPVKEISAGYYHSAFLTESGLVYVCGESESGKLGIDVNFSTQVAPKQMQLPVPALHVACGGHHTLVLAENGNIYCTGSNASGQLGMGTGVTEVHTPKLLPRGPLQGETIVKIACGESHSAILSESGKLFTCGDGRHGKLGLEENENNVHEVTFAAKYQELFVSTVSCGGCHTILVGRRHEINYQSQRPSNSIQAINEQKKSSLPPLKLPVNMQNEQQMENSTEHKSANGVDDSIDKIDETRPENKDVHANASEDTSARESDAAHDSSKDEHAASVEESSETSKRKIEESQATGDEEAEKEGGNEQNESKPENTESEETNSHTVENNQKDDEDAAKVPATTEKQAEEMEATTNERIEEHRETNSTPPPKPPRIKSGNVEETSDKKESKKEEEEKEEKKEDEGGDAETNENGEKAEEKTETSEERDASSAGGELEHAVKEIEDIAEAVENSIEKVEEEHEHTGEPEKAEVDGAQDDADVVQSPAPRTGKMAKLFKARRQEIQNGTKKTGSTANLKAKSKTCAIL